MLHKVSNLTNVTNGGNENKTDNIQGEFGLCCISGKTVGVMNDHAIYLFHVDQHIRHQTISEKDLHLCDYRKPLLIIISYLCGYV